jgi:hypothetical protein
MPRALGIVRLWRNPAMAVRCQLGQQPVERFPFTWRQSLEHKVLALREKWDDFLVNRLTFSSNGQVLPLTGPRLRSRVPCNSGIGF